jgi:hypothetical protein
MCDRFLERGAVARASRTTKNGRDNDLKIARLGVRRLPPVVAGVVTQPPQNEVPDLGDARAAAAQRVAEVANSMRTTDPRTAMLLGLAAWRFAALPESRAALLAAPAQPERDAFTDPGPGAAPNGSSSARDGSC